VPAAEIDHFGLAREVGFEERGALQAGSVRHARESKFQGSIRGVFETF
jgi:hypothetical protein